MAYPFIRNAILPLLNKRIVSAEGLDNIPKSGPALLVANHVGFHDPLLLISALVVSTKGRKIYVITKWKMFRWKIFQNWIGSIPLYEDRIKTFDKTRRILNKGGLVLIYPEGKVGRLDEISKVKSGAARLALATHLPVIPIGLHRTSKLPKNVFVRYLEIFFSCVKIHIGQPLDLHAWYHKKIDRLLLDEVMRAIMVPVANLANKKYKH